MASAHLGWPSFILTFFCFCLTTAILVSQTRHLTDVTPRNQKYSKYLVGLCWTCVAAWDLFMLEYVVISAIQIFVPSEDITPGLCVLKYLPGPALLIGKMTMFLFFEYRFVRTCAFRPFPVRRPPPKKAIHRLQRVGIRLFQTPHEILCNFYHNILFTRRRGYVIICHKIGHRTFKL